MLLRSDEQMIRTSILHSLLKDECIVIGEQKGAGFETAFGYEKPETRHIYPCLVTGLKSGRDAIHGDNLIESADASVLLPNDAIIRAGDFIEVKEKGAYRVISVDNSRSFDFICQCTCKKIGGKGDSL